MTVNDPSDVLRDVEAPPDAGLMAGGITVLMYYNPEGRRRYAVQTRGDVSYIEYLGMLEAAKMDLHDMNEGRTSE